MAVPIAAPVAGPVTKISLSISLQNLPDLDILSKTDAKVLVFQRQGSHPQVKIGSTEKSKDNLNPRFATPIVIDYYFEAVQELVFIVGDVDDHKTDSIGTFQCTLGSIVGAKGQQITANLMMAPSTYRQSTISIRAEEVRGNNMSVEFKWAGSQLDKKDVGLFAKSDPYFNILKANPDGTTTLVYKSDYKKQTLDPVWKDFTLPLSHLCAGDLKRPLVIEVWDWDKHSDHDLIGIVNTTTEQLMSAKFLDIINPKKVGKKSYKNSGILSINSAVMIQEYSFLDYLAGGVQLNMAVGIDYTGSNGEPSQPTSLHYRAPGSRNSYMDVLFSVGNILLPYDYDGWIPAYGFGAKLKSSGKVSFCFPINGAPELAPRPEVLGVQGLLDAYQGSFNLLSLYGPTDMAPIINAIANEAAEIDKLGSDINAYLLMLIITDGEITDMPETLSAIVRASALPMSIIIVGVGNADFTNMNHLDSDDGHLKAPNGSKAVRDIVQFVPFNRFASDPSRLAAETLAELPKQVVQFMKYRNIKPRPRVIVQETIITQTSMAVANTQI